LLLALGLGTPLVPVQRYRFLRWEGRTEKSSVVDLRCFNKIRFSFFTFQLVSASFSQIQPDSASFSQIQPDSARFSQFQQFQRVLARFSLFQLRLANCFR
jgi:hypothetical protein